MTITTDVHETPDPGTNLGMINHSDTPQVPLGRLVMVEFRKALDTRAGRWLALSLLAVVLVVEVIIALVAPESELTYGDFIGFAGGVLGYFLPILVIMLVTSEASQRNGLVTFTLEPRRSRVVAAKFIASFALAAVVMALSALLAAVGMGVAMARGASAGWSVDTGQLLTGFLLANVIGILVGFAIATLLMNTAAAIVGYFVYSLILPTAAFILSQLSDGFAKVAPWIELNTAQVPLLDPSVTPTGQEWAQFGVAATIWLVIPLILGIMRLLRIEFK